MNYKSSHVFDGEWGVRLNRGEATKSSCLAGVNDDGQVLDRNLNKALWSVMHGGVEDQKIACFEEEDRVAVPIVDFA